MEFVESQTLEFKEQFNDSCKHTIVAFLSHGSGAIYVGINKYGKPVKLNDIDAIQREISNFLIDQVSPRCIELVKTSLEEFDGYTVIKIEVTQGGKLFYIKKYGLSVKGCYIRIGSTTREMSDDEIMAKYEANMPKPNIIDLESRKQNLTFQVLKIYLTEHYVDFKDEYFDSTFELRNKDGKYNVMAYILSDQFDESIKVCRFEGHGGNLTMRKEFGRGCIFKIYNEIKDYMQSQINIPHTYFDHGTRRDEYLYNETAFVEAWKNAILHNDYAEEQYPAIYLFDDHLEVFSNGNPLRNVSFDEFVVGKSRPINTVLAKIAMNIEITDQTGKGNKDIISIYGKEAFEIMAHTLTVKIPYNPLAFGDTTTTTTTTTTTSNLILELIKNNNQITAREIAEQLNMTKDGAQYHLNKLKQGGKIVRRGGNFGGHWEIVK